MRNYLLKADLSVFVFKEGNTFIAYSPALDLSTCADTYEKSKKRFNEIVNIFFEEITKRNLANIKT